MLLQNGYAFASLVSHEKLIETSKAEYYLALNQTQRMGRGRAATAEATARAPPGYPVQAPN